MFLLWYESHVLPGMGGPWKTVYSDSSANYIMKQEGGYVVFNQIFHSNRQINYVQPPLTRELKIGSGAWGFFCFELVKT